MTALLLAAATLSGDLTLMLRSQRPDASAADPRYATVLEDVAWPADKTAIVVCDMWDAHWCASATARVAEMAPHMNRVLNAARERGVLIIHCPSAVTDFYEGTPQRELARSAPPVETAEPLLGWCHLDRDREPPLPIDDADGGCDCVPPCETASPWTRQIDAIEIRPGDAVTDSAEAFYLMRRRGIENVAVMGVHLNFCVLGRPFAVRQLVKQGMNVVLVRDLTDSMYDPRDSPYVGHFDGTQLMVQHVERHWCPSVLSTDLSGLPAFRFSADPRKSPQPAAAAGENTSGTPE